MANIFKATKRINPYSAVRGMTVEQIQYWIQEHMFLDPMWDESFKILLGNPEHPEFLIDLLNNILRLQGDERIQSITFQNPEQIICAGFEKRVMFDLHCITEKGEPIIVELQRTGSDLFVDRMLYYASTVIRKTIPKGESSFRLPNIYTIAIMDFTLPISQGEYRYCLQLMDKNHPEILYPKLTMLFLEIPNFNKQEQDLRNEEDCWIWSLKNMGDLKTLPNGIQNPTLIKFLEAAFTANFQPESIMKIARSYFDEAAFNDEKSWERREGYEEGMEDGITLGEARGEARGEAQGIAIGEARGKLKGKMEIAKNLFAKGLPIALIAETTGLGAQDLEELANC